MWPCNTREVFSHLARVVVAVAIGEATVLGVADGSAVGVIFHVYGVRRVKVRITSFSFGKFYNMTLYHYVTKQNK